MKLHNGTLYWPTTLSTKLNVETPKQPKKQYDAIVIGGGMSGCLTAYRLMKQGLTVAILDKRKFGQGSTAANTGLLQYSNDIMLSELIQQIGEKEAVRFYQLCFEALDDIEEIANELPHEVDFVRVPSIYYASDEKDAAKLRTEYETLYMNKFPCEFWDESTLSFYMPFKKPAAIVTFRDAEINPLKFITSLLTYLQNQGVDLFEETVVTDTSFENQLVQLKTTTHSFQAKDVVYTIGYEKKENPKREDTIFNRSYVMVTKPIDLDKLWHQKAMIWETKRPYLYLRTTAEGAIMVGGMDENIPEAPVDEKVIENCAEKLLKQTNSLFPHLELEVDCCYAATFAESKDQLPFIGAHPTKPHHYYLLGYGGNGTIYSALGSKIISDLIAGRENNDSHIVSPKRNADTNGLPFSSIA
ncbi:FAD-binding oxidoreductase [Lysinibacillus sp. SGAir0095]|uniref:NAD(P)/FAD-dependent oxidoreductase n=1 Tax=Lysinibacillus sp. SGAir0095 TaxID=2070463 RepID=UPI0010CD0B81|nr:FAD-dependent oxidoreductase [Lysinibacillus sp. SGAir0095]QCR31664.1 FAD-binding oxidoreductase [Lysinibacillus sp. SGAir0095]